MSTKYTFACKRCRYSIGMSMCDGYESPWAYRKIAETAKSGKLGEDIRQFLKDHPEGRLDTETVLLQCTECHCLKTAPALSMFLPKEGTVRSRRDFAVPQELRDNYRLYEHSQYKCHKCGAPMKTIREEKLEEMVERAGFQSPVEELPCPECGKTLDYTGKQLWV